MKVIQSHTGAVKISLNPSEFTALQAIVEHGYAPAKKAVGGRGFGSFEAGLEVTETREKRPSNNPNFGKRKAEG